MEYDANIQIEVVERDDMLVLVVRGELDLSAAPLLDESLAMAADTDATAIVVDLNRVSFMDSAGVHVLLQHSLSERNRDRMILTRGSPQVQRLLGLTGVERYIPFVSWPVMADGQAPPGGGRAGAS
jgi:anti-sigma B factor antagonist